MSDPAKRDHAHVAAEIKRVLDVVASERAHALACYDDLTALVLSANAADLAERPLERDGHCARLLDLAHELLGDCEEVEPLCTLLGYEMQPESEQ